jgi:hypothetical protein
MRLDALIEEQYGIVRRDQLVQRGCTPYVIRHRLASGQWQAVVRGVYALFPGPLEVRHRLLAGSLYGGAHAQIAGPTAAQLHGLCNAPPDVRVHLLVPHRHQLASSGFVVVHRTTRLDTQPHRFEPFEVCSIPRAVADTARWCPDPPVIRALVGEAVTRGFTTLDALRVEGCSARRNGSALLRITLDQLDWGNSTHPRGWSQLDLLVVTGEYTLDARSPDATVAASGPAGVAGQRTGDDASVPVGCVLHDHRAAVPL